MRATKYRSRVFTTMAGLMLLAGTMVGCADRNTGVMTRLPIIDRGVRPPIKSVSKQQMACLDVDTRTDIQSDIEFLMMYGEQLEREIDKYNSWAKEMNMKNGY